MISPILFENCVKKDTDAWDFFIKKYTPLVRKSVTYKLKNLGLPPRKDKIDEIAQEIFISIWEKNKLSKIRDIKALKSWLVIVSLNMTSNYCRKHIFKFNRLLVPLEKEISPNNDLTLREILPSPGKNARDELNLKELEEMVRKEITKLPQNQQLALKLNIYEHKKYREISEIMHIPEGTVATLINRAKKFLCNKMVDMDCDDRS